NRSVDVLSAARRRRRCRIDGGAAEQRRQREQAGAPEQLTPGPASQHSQHRWLSPLAAATGNQQFGIPNLEFVYSFAPIGDRGHAFQIPNSKFSIACCGYSVAITSISTSELPAIPPAAAIVVRTGGSAPNRPWNISFMPA